MLSWTQPSGGAALTHYEYELDLSDTWTSTGGTTTSHHGDGPDQRDRAYAFPGAGGQQRRCERGLRFGFGHAHDHGAGRAREPELHAPETGR